MLTSASKNISQNLTDIRRRKNLSQAQLASLSGMTRASIALLESGSANPTLEILIKLSIGLSISIDELISKATAECELIRALDVPLDRRSKNGVILRKLLPEKLPATDIDELSLEPGAVLTGSPHIEGTKEYFTCLKGDIMIGILGQTYSLKKGDVLAFPGNHPHSYKNTGNTTASGISVVFFHPQFT